jgi:hypothetical protein
MEAVILECHIKVSAVAYELEIYDFSVIHTINGKTPYLKPVLVKCKEF